MSEHPSNQTSGDIGANAVGVGPVVRNAATTSETSTANADNSDVATGPTATGLASADAAKEAPKVETPKIDATPADAPKIDVTPTDAPKLGAYTADTPKIDAARTPGKIMVMSPSRDNTWRENVDPEPAPARKRGLFGKRRAAALAAVIALAALAGALGGALATSGFHRSATDDTKTAASARLLQDSISRIETEVAALRTSLEHTSKLSVTQFNKASERLDKVEKAQVEPAAKLAKITEAMERLRTGPAAAAAPAVAAGPASVAAAPVAPRETSTASISPPPVASAPKTEAARTSEVARLPTVEGWVLRDVADGGAVIEGRRGAFEVYAGDNIPGLGRVDAIRRQDGRWVVVTSKGLVVSR